MKRLVIQILAMGLMFVVVAATLSSVLMSFDSLVKADSRSGAAAFHKTFAFVDAGLNSPDSAQNSRVEDKIKHRLFDASQMQTATEEPLVFQPFGSGREFLPMPNHHGRNVYHPPEGNL